MKYKIGINVLKDSVRLTVNAKKALAYILTQPIDKNCVVLNKDILKQISKRRTALYALECLVQANPLYDNKIPVVKFVTKENTGNIKVELHKRFIEFNNIDQVELDFDIIKDVSGWVMLRIYELKKYIEFTGVNTYKVDFVKSWFGFNQRNNVPMLVALLNFNKSKLFGLNSKNNTVDGKLDSITFNFIEE